MIFLILAMGFLNLGVGIMLAIQLGFGPPTLYALWESIGTMPEANEVAASSGEMLADDGFTESDVTNATGLAAATPVETNSTPVPVATPAPPESLASPSAEVVAEIKAAITEESQAVVDAEADLANNPFLEQSVLDEVRAMAGSLTGTGDQALSTEA